MDTVTTANLDARRTNSRDKIAAYVELTKPRIALLLVLTSAAGFYLASSDEFDWPLFAHAMAAITLLAFGVATLNQWMERDIDPLMKRTENRPLPLRRISSVEALIFGVLQCVFAEVYLFTLVNPLTGVLGLIVIVGYVFLYTPLKTKTSASTVIGAIPGALPPLMGWTAAADQITIGAWALFVMQFLWQFPHFFAIAWMYRDQYKKAGIKMLPVVEPSGRLTFRQIILFTVMLVPVSLAPFFLGVSGFIFLTGAAILGVIFLIASVRSALDRSVERSRTVLLVSVIYLPLLFILMVADKN